MEGWRWSVCLVVSLAVMGSGMTNDELEDFSNFLRKTSVLDLSLKDGYDSSQESDDDEDKPSDYAWETSGKFEGDLILNDRQRRLIVEDVAVGLSRNGLKDSTKRWPDNEVVYYIQREHFSGDQVQAIQDGIDDLARASCVKFRPYKKGDRDAVVIQGSRRGCFSQVGYQGGYQVLNLSGRHPVGRGCFRHGTIVHEMLHTLGFYHMQSSPDRDDYIDVIWENVVQPARHNFKKYNSFSVSDFGVGYDYESVLHYSRKAFSNNGGDTLVPKQAGAEIGQRVGLSDKDTQKLNKMYCDADSNNFDQDEGTLKPQVIKKKKQKTTNRQPFQGHGLGYHQGKAVVIKIPVAETLILSDSPSIHSFDYFSKAPKALQPTLAQGFRTGQEVKPLQIGEHKYTKLIEKTSSNNDKVPNYLSETHRTKDVIDFEGSKELINNKKSNTYDPPYSVEFSMDYKNKISDAFKRLEFLKNQSGFLYPDFTKKIDFSKYYKSIDKSEPDSESKKVDEHFARGPKMKSPEINKYREVEPTYSKEAEHDDAQDFDSSYGTKLPAKSLKLDETYSSPKKIYTDSELERLENLHDYDSFYGKKSDDTSKEIDYKIFGSPVPFTDPWYNTGPVKESNDTKPTSDSSEYNTKKGINLTDIEQKILSDTYDDNRYRYNPSDHNQYNIYEPSYFNDWLRKDSTEGSDSSKVDSADKSNEQGNRSNYEHDSEDEHIGSNSESKSSEDTNRNSKEIIGYYVKHSDENDQVKTTPETVTTTQIQTFQYSKETMEEENGPASLEKPSMYEVMEKIEEPTTKKFVDYTKDNKKVQQALALPKGRRKFDEYSELSSYDFDSPDHDFDKFYTNKHSPGNYIYEL